MYIIYCIILEHELQNSTKLYTYMEYINDSKSIMQVLYHWANILLQKYVDYFIIYLLSLLHSIGS